MAKEGLAGYVVPSTDAHQVGAQLELFTFFSLRMLVKIHEFSFDPV